MITAIKQQNEVRVFINELGEIAISQSCDDPETPTHCVSLWPEYAEALVRAIRRAKREALEAREAT
jgi:hypothetical protein